MGLSHIKTIYDKYGMLTWYISNNSIDTSISVTSDLTKTTLDLTDLDSW